MDARWTVDGTQGYVSMLQHVATCCPVEGETFFPPGEHLRKSKRLTFKSASFWSYFVFCLKFDFLIHALNGI